MAKIAIFAPTLLKVCPVKPAGSPLAGAELSMIHLQSALGRIGHTLVCFTNLGGAPDGANLQSLSRFNENDFDIVIYSRTYGHRPVSSEGAPRRILWLHDTVEEAASLIDGSTEELAQAISRFDHLVFVSAWHRLHYLSTFIAYSELEGKSTSIYHLLPEVPTGRALECKYDVIHTGHPRKALAQVLDIYDLLKKERPRLRLALVDSASIYQEQLFFFEGHETTLQALLRSRYGEQKPPFEIIPPLPQGDLIRLLATCRVLLHPDQSTETGATTVLEAVLAGCIPVVSDLGCLPELVCGAGTILPPPGKVPLRVYAQAVCAAVDQPTRRISPDDPRDIVTHNAVQMGRWQRLLGAHSISVAATAVEQDGFHQDFNVKLAAHSEHLDMELAATGSGIQTHCRIGVHVFPRQALALMGVLEPVILPAFVDDVDRLASAYAIRMRELTEDLKQRGVSRMIMKLTCHPESRGVLRALLCASSVIGARAMTLRNLLLDLSRDQDEDDFERRSFSRRLGQQVTASRDAWTLRHISKNIVDFDLWFGIYETHRRRFNSSGIDRHEAYRVFNSDGSIGLYGALAVEKMSGEVGGFYVIVRVGKFAFLHSWGTTHRYKSNLHKLLIADSIRIARRHGVTLFEYGSDLSEHGVSFGLNTLYRGFGGLAGACIQVNIAVPESAPRYSVT